MIPLEGLGDRVAVHAVCRENVFWETLEQLKSVGRELRAGAAGREDAGLKHPMRILDWNITVDRGAARALCSGRRSAMPRASPRDAARRSSTAVRRERRCGAARADAALRRRARSSPSRSPPPEFAEAERSARSPRSTPPSTARSRRCTTFHAAQLPARAARGDGARRPVRAHQRAGARRGPVRAGGLRAPALDRHHARACPPRSPRCPQRITLHAADPRRARRSGGAGGGTQGGRASGSSRSAAPRPSPPWRTAPDSCPNATSCSARAMPGSRRPSCWSPLIPRAPPRSARRRQRGHGRRRRARPRGVRRGGPARAGRARRRRASAAGHPVAALARARRARSASRKCTRLSRRDILGASMRRDAPARGRVARRRAFEVANDYAPEHLLLAVREPRRWLAESRSAREPCSSAAGRPSRWATTAADRITRCRLTATHAPTAACRVEDFQKRITVQELSPAGLAGTWRDRTHPGADSRDWTRHAAAVTSASPRSRSAAL